MKLIFAGRIFEFCNTEKLKGKKSKVSRRSDLDSGFQFINA